MPLLPQTARTLAARRTAASALLVLLLTTIPAERIGAQTPGTTPADGCIVADQLQARSCRLRNGVTAESEVVPRHGGATWRLDLLAPDATLDLVVGAEHGNPVASVLDWRGQTLSTSVQADDADDARLSIVLPLPGVYGIRVSGDPPPERVRYHLTATVTYPTQPRSPAWPPDLIRDAVGIDDDRHVIQVPRGGTPAGGVAASRILGAPPDAIFSDFMLVSDVRFEQVVGSSALTVRFRYEPEAGGGTGYVLSIDPFKGTATLDSFDEGRRRTIVGDVPLPFMPTSEGANRLMLTASGPMLRATLDGQTIVEASDDRFAKGLIAVGAITWSEPVTVTFDHIQVTTPPR